MMGGAGALEHWLSDGTEGQTCVLISCHVERFSQSDAKDDE